VKEAGRRNLPLLSCACVAGLLVGACTAGPSASSPPGASAGAGGSTPVVVASPTRTPAPTIPGPSGKFAYWTCATGTELPCASSGIALRVLDLSSLQDQIVFRETVNPPSKLNPGTAFWSPDAKTLLLTYGRCDQSPVSATAFNCASLSKTIDSAGLTVTEFPLLYQPTWLSSSGPIVGLKEDDHGTGSVVLMSSSGVVQRSLWDCPKTFNQASCFFGSVAVASDNQRVAFIARDPTKQPSPSQSPFSQTQITLATVDGSAPVQLTNVTDEVLPGYRGMSNLRWSPDGGRIAFVASARDGSVVCTVTLADRNTRCFPTLANLYELRVEWLADGSHLLASVKSKADNTKFVVGVLDLAAETVTELMATNIWTYTLAPDRRSFLFLTRDGSDLQAGRLYIYRIEDRAVLGPFGQGGVLLIAPAWSASSN
jgi:hypothetical protein